MKRTFELTLTRCITIELDDAVIDVINDASWRASFYDYSQSEDIAGIMGLALCDGYRLSDLDGWADQPDSNARITHDSGLDVESCIEIIK